MEIRTELAAAVKSMAPGALRRKNLFALRDILWRQLVGRRTVSRFLSAILRSLRKGGERTSCDAHQQRAEQTSSTQPASQSHARASGGAAQFLARAEVVAPVDRTRHRHVGIGEMDFARAVRRGLRCRCARALGIGASGRSPIAVSRRFTISSGSSGATCPERRVQMLEGLCDRTDLPVNHLLGCRPASAA